MVCTPCHDDQDRPVQGGFFIDFHIEVGLYPNCYRTCKTILLYVLVDFEPSLTLWKQYSPPRRHEQRVHPAGKIPKHNIKSAG